MSKNTIDYPYFRYPRALTDDPLFRKISIEARTLLAMILDRFSLSTVNADKFTDENGDIYVIYTLEQVCEKLGCSYTRTQRIFKELEENGMIIRKRQNRLSPYRIYVTDSFCELIKREVTTSQNEDSRVYGLSSHDFTKRTDSYNNKSNNNNSNNQSSIIGFERTEDEIREQIEYEYIVCDANKNLLDEMVMIIFDVLNGTSPTVRIGKNDMPRGAVIARFCKLNSEHIYSVFSKLDCNTSKIKNIKQYLIAMLYNAPSTMESELTADFACYKNK